MQKPTRYAEIPMLCEKQNNLIKNGKSRFQIKGIANRTFRKTHRLFHLTKLSHKPYDYVGCAKRYSQIAITVSIPLPNCVSTVASGDHVISEQPLRQHLSALSQNLQASQSFQKPPSIDTCERRCVCLKFSRTMQMNVIDHQWKYLGHHFSLTSISPFSKTLINLQH